MKRPAGFDADSFGAQEPERIAPIISLSHDTDAEDVTSNSLVTQQAELDNSQAELDNSQAELDSTAAVTELAAPDPIRAAKQRLKTAERKRRQTEKREMRRFSAATRRRRQRVLVVIGAVLALALFVVVGAFTPIMAVKEVKVVGAVAVDEAKLSKALLDFEGVPLALVKNSEVHRVLEQFPLIQRYTVERIVPHTLLLRIEERDPVIALQIAENEYSLFDAAGVELERTEKPPRGVPVGKKAVAKPESTAFHEAAAIVRDMPEDIRAQLKSVAATNQQDVTFTIKSNVKVVWGDAAQTQRKSVVLRAMLENLNDVTMINVSAPEGPVFK